jgi:Family of unknown function (DUF6510)
MQKLDGNVLAGPLSEVMTGDATSAHARCVHCGDVVVIAQAVVYADGSRFVARCRRWDSVLLPIVEAGDDVRLTMTGVTAFTMPV